MTAFDKTIHINKSFNMTFCGKGLANHLDFYVHATNVMSW